MLPHIVVVSVRNTIFVTCTSTGISVTGTWSEKFETRSTKPQDFTLSNGQVVKTPMMKQKADFYLG